jgi:hypothetical protein
MYRCAVIVAVLAIGLMTACESASDAKPVIPPLAQQVADDLAPYMTFTREGTCASTNSERIAFNTRDLPHALADMLAEPDASLLTLTQLETLANQGIASAKISIIGGYKMSAEVDFIDGQNGNFLVNIHQFYCPLSNHGRQPWYVYVFDRQGGFWEMEYGRIDDHSVQWMNDHWIMLIGFVGGCCGSASSLIHVVHSIDGWESLAFLDMPHAPNLTWIDTQPNLRFEDGYRKLVVQGGGNGYSPPPCDLDFDKLKSHFKRAGESDLTWLGVMNTVYRGTLTYRWQGNSYQLTDESPYEVTVIFDNYKLLSSHPLAHQPAWTNPFFQFKSWKEFCLDA